jgi:hypothetical protein
MTFQRQHAENKEEEKNQSDRAGLPLGFMHLPHGGYRYQ